MSGEWKSSGCVDSADWLIPESNDDVAPDVPELAGEESSRSTSSVLQGRIENTSPQRNIETRIPERDVDFRAVGFLAGFFNEFGRLSEVDFSISGFSGTATGLLSTTGSDGVSGIDLPVIGGFPYPTT